MRRLLVLVTLALLYTACMPPLDHPRVSRDLDVSETPAQVFPRAVKATMAVQGKIGQQDATLGIIQATVQQGISLHVIITPQGTGSHIEVAQQVLPTHIVYGPILLADAWLTAYQQQQ